MPPSVKKWLPAAGLLAALAWFCLGIHWGLPSRRADPFLFGRDRAPWTGAQILELAGGPEASAERGADVDANPVISRERPVVLNDTDARRAEIVRRYRLYSYQPDEMITFNALRQMRPGQLQLDPKLYQYGGLWMYPVGALLKVASALRLITLQPDVAFYLDQPEQFGRFYVVARFYSALWGVVGVWAVYKLVARILPDRDEWPEAPYVAAACFAALPVVVNAAHEAKPHLAGAVLMLLAVLAASHYVTDGRRWWVLSGVLCGAAQGMVLSSLPGFVVLPLMALLCRGPWGRRVMVCLASTLIAVGVYFLTNPYVLIHLLRHDPVLWSNLGNSAAMYSVGGSSGAIRNAVVLIAEGTGWLAFVFGVVGAVGLGVRAIRRRKDQSPAEVSRRATGLLLAAPALLVAVQFTLLAAGKPGEYGRFALLPAVFLLIEAVVGIQAFDDGFMADNFSPKTPRWQLFPLLLFMTLVGGGNYVLKFIEDSGAGTTRLQAAADLARVSPGCTLAVDAEPAPYSLPPVNLFTHPIVLLPRGGATSRPMGDCVVRVRPVDVPTDRSIPMAPPTERLYPARISWAGKSFEVAEVNPAGRD